ncbi:hypothetical protein ACFV98_11935 [Streptomyces violascens]|uniref:hypothetical protein n=1 Tax=Streptomyces violascens TaxID=67381 RepID=UPI003668E76A
MGYSQPEVIGQVSDAFEIVREEFGFDLDTPEGDAIGLVISALIHRLDNPNSSIESVTRERYGLSVSEIRQWWNWSDLK